MILQNAGRVAAPTPPPRSPGIEFYSIEMSALQSGMIGISVLATTFDEVELELQSRELGASQATTIDDALAFIKANVAFS